MPIVFSQNWNLDVCISLLAQRGNCRLFTDVWRNGRGDLSVLQVCYTLFCTRFSRVTSPEWVDHTSSLMHSFIKRAIHQEPNGPRSDSENSLNSIHRKSHTYRPSLSLPALFVSRFMWIRFTMLFMYRNVFTFAALHLFFATVKGQLSPLVVCIA